MQSSRLAIRQCRASSAYSITHALTSTFSTAARRAQDEAVRQKRSDRDTDRGSFADYEAIYEQLQRPEEEMASNRGEKRPAPNSHSSVRSAPVAADGDTETPPGHVQDRFPSTPTFHGRLSRRPLIMVRPPRATSNRGAPPTRRFDFRTPSNPSETQPEDESLWTRVDRERQEAKAAARMAPGGDKYIMHAIAKWVGALSSGKETTFDWSDEEGVERMRTILDYDPRFIPPTESPLEKRVPEPWALGRHAVVGMNASDILEEEIKRFAAWAAPTSAETAARQLVIQQTQDFIRTNMIKVVPRVRTQLFGSGATGLALATSDIDIRVYNADNRESWEQRHRAMGHPMRVLASQMGRSEDFMCVTMRWSNYPIINAQHRATGIDIQIVSSPSTAKQEAVTATYLAELPHLRDLFHIMRTMLGMRNLVDVFNGGVGSYGLFIMLVAALKRGQRSSAPPRTVVEQFLHILDFYAHFPLTTDGLTVEPRPKPFKKHPLNSIASGVRQSRIHAASRRSDDARAGQWAIGVLRPLQPYLLCLQDPADPTNDLGRKSNAIKHLQASCQYVLIGVRKKLELVDARRRTEWRQDSILDGVVGRCHEVLQERRRRVEEWGKEKAELEELRRREEGAAGVGEAGGGQEVIAAEGMATEGTTAEGMAVEGTAAEAMGEEIREES